LLDRGFLRIGSEEYKVTNDAYGLATMLKSHVTLHDETIRFDYVAKESKRRVLARHQRPTSRRRPGTTSRRGGGVLALLEG